MKNLTPRQRDLVRFIMQWHKENGFDTEADRDWLKEKMKIEESRISALRTILVNKGVIRSDRGGLYSSNRTRRNFQRHK